MAGGEHSDGAHGAHPVCHREDAVRLLLKPDEAADILGIGRSTLYELLAAGRIESVQIGRSRRIPMTVLEEYVEQLRAEQRSPVGRHRNLVVH
jgi:excisionase family DNA binding protein